MSVGFLMLFLVVVGHSHSASGGKLVRNRVFLGFYLFLNKTLRFSLHSEHLLILSGRSHYVNVSNMLGTLQSGGGEFRMCSPFLDEDRGGEDGRAEDDGSQNTDNG